MIAMSFHALDEAGRNAFGEARAVSSHMVFEIARAGYRLEELLLLRREVHHDEPVRHADPARDLANGGSLVPALAEDGPGGREDRRPGGRNPATGHST
jgi:hypothetical protein